jgi:PAS domain S-box-containing protein
VAWNPFILPWVIVGALLIALSSVIYVRQRASRVAVLFCLMIALVAAWFLAFAMMFSVTDADLAMVCARVSIVAVCFLPGAIYDFTATALRLYERRRRMVRVVWGMAALFAAFAAFSRYLVAGVALRPWGFYATAGPLLPLFLFLFFGALASQLIEGTLEYRRTLDPKRRRRIAQLIISFAVVYLGAIDFVPMFGVPMRPMGYLPVIAFMFVAWSSIRRHRFTPITAARAAREILATMADALFVVDASGCIRVVNDAVRALLGYGSSDLLGRSIDTLEVTGGDATISRTLGELSRRGAIRDQERLLRHRDGHAIDVSVSISPVSEENVQEGAVVIARDIRERKDAEAELRSAMKRLEQSNRELEDFAYVASHDLQEPLRKIQAFGDLLKSKHAAAMQPQARDYIDRMQSAAGRMQVLINDLLSFSRVTTKAQPFAPVDLGAIAREVAHDLEIRAHDTGGEIVVGELPAIEADALQMRQLLQNLAGNALKFHRPEVPPRVEINGAAENGRVLITVRDNGIGFDEKYADRIFTMFERLHGRGAYEGTGIGLAICRKIAERHGGTITARSTPGEGSEFRVTLPAKHDHTRSG